MERSKGWTYKMIEVDGRAEYIVAEYRGSKEKVHEDDNIENKVVIKMNKRSGDYNSLK